MNSDNISGTSRKVEAPRAANEQNAINTAPDRLLEGKMIKQMRGSGLVVSSVEGRMPAAGVHWAGEFHLLRTLGEKDAFVIQLTRLGYKLNDFRVTVRRILGDGRKQIRYNVFVDELRDGLPYRGKAYIGGYGEKWIDQFAVRASADFPKA